MYLILCKRSDRRVSTRKIESKVFKLYQGDPTMVSIINFTFYYRRYSPYCPSFLPLTSYQLITYYLFIRSLIDLPTRHLHLQAVAKENTSDFYTRSYLLI